MGRYRRESQEPSRDPSIFNLIQQRIAEAGRDCVELLLLSPCWPIIPSILREVVMPVTDCGVRLRSGGAK